MTKSQNTFEWTNMGGPSEFLSTNFVHIDVFCCRPPTMIIFCHSRRNIDSPLEKSILHQLACREFIEKSLGRVLAK